MRKEIPTMGKLIVIDGIDGSGKATQSKKLADFLAGKGIDAVRVDFPRYGTKGAALVESYLSGELGGKPEDTGAYATSLFYAMDRYYSYRTGEWGRKYDSGATVICDRYTTANAIHQCAKLPREEWDGYLEWLWDTEYGKIGIPKPDAIVFLDMKPSVFESLIDSRARKNSSAKDIHESDGKYLESCYEAALYACEKLGWRQIKCYSDDKPRSIDDIFADLTAALADLI